MKKKTLKEREVIAAALLATILLVISTSGCVSQTPSPTPHDALLESLVSVDYNQTAARATITIWNVAWNNSTAVNIQFAVQNQTQNATASGNRTFLRLSSIDEAASFVNSTNLTGFTLNASVPASAPGLINFSLLRLYENVTGHLPTIYRMYLKPSEGQNTLNLLAIAQADDVVSLVNVTAVRTGVAPTPTPTPVVSPITTPVAPVTATPSPTPATTTAAAR